MNSILYKVWLVGFIFMAFATNTFGQNPGREQLYLHYDKYACLPGDTIWFKGYITRGGVLSGLSTNLYVELWTDSGSLVHEELFPALNGQAIGQVPVPNSIAQGTYWLRAYTKSQVNNKAEDLFTVPIVVTGLNVPFTKFWKNENAISKTATLEKVSIQPDTLNTDPYGYNSWLINIRDSSQYHYSISINDADKDIPGYIYLFEPQNNELLQDSSDKLDTNFLNWSGRALKAYSKRVLLNKDIVFLLVKDSTILTRKIVPIDSIGHFQLDHLFFFDKANLLYQLNEEGSNAKNIRLIFDQMQRPGFSRPTGWKEMPLSRPSLLSHIDIKRDNLATQAKGRVLKEVDIKGWKSPRKALDYQYTSGEFTEPAMYSFDLRTDKRYNDLGNYLRLNLPGFQGGYSMGDTPSYKGKQLLFYVDQELKTWDELSSYWFVEIAYIKAFESDFIGNDPYTKWKTGVGGFNGFNLGKPTNPNVQPTPMIIAIYTRKGNDIRTGWPGLNTVTVSGYTPIKKFQQTNINDPITIYWEPLIDKNQVRIRFSNSERGQHFKITVTGINDDGETINFTAIYPK